MAISNVNRVKLRVLDILERRLLMRDEGEVMKSFAFTEIENGILYLVLFPCGMYTNNGGAVRMMPDDIRMNKPEIYKSTGDFEEDLRPLHIKMLCCLLKAFPEERSEEEIADAKARESAGAGAGA